MVIYQDTVITTSNGSRPSYHNNKDQQKEIVPKSGVKNGIMVVQSPHPTCSVIFQENVHDPDLNRDEFLRVNLKRILAPHIPRELTRKHG